MDTPTTTPPPTPQYPGPVFDERPYSKLAIWSLVLGILFLCLGPLGLVPLIMGIVAIGRTGANGPRRGLGLAIAGTSLGAVGVMGTCLSAGIFLPALGTARERATELKSQSQIRMQLQAAIVYAGDNNDQFPPQDQWPDAVIDLGLIEPGLFVSPLEDGDGISYIYLSGENTFDADQIVIYEDPAHHPQNVLVGFADGTVSFIPHADFQQMLEDQTGEVAP